MQFTIILLLLAPSWIQAASGSAQEQLLDRIVAVVDKDVITLSDIRTEKLMREVLGEAALKNDREVLDELIDQHVIRAELDRFPHAEPSEAQLDEAVSQIKDIRGLPREAVRAAVRDHLRVQHFFADKFGEFIVISDNEIQRYYDEVFLPAAQTRGLTPIPDLTAVREYIRRIIGRERSLAEVKKWLEQARRTMKIEIFD